MKKVIPYEHNVNIIAKMCNESELCIEKLYHRFINTEDKWIKKLIALRILESKVISKIDFDLTEIKKSIECQINI